MPLYLVKYSRPDLANAMRVLPKTTKGSKKELLRVLRITMDTRDLGLKMEVDQSKCDTEWEIVAYSDWRSWR